MSERQEVCGVVWERCSELGKRWQTVGKTESGGVLAVLCDTTVPDFREFVGDWWSEETSADNPIALIYTHSEGVMVKGFEDDEAAMLAYARRDWREAA